MATDSNEEVVPRSTISDNPESAHSMPSSLLTEEDWDQLLAKEQKQQQQQQQQCQRELKASLVSTLPMMTPSNSLSSMSKADSGGDSSMSESEEKKDGGGGGIVASIRFTPTKAMTEIGRHSNPTSPNELLRMTKRGTVEENEEVNQFEKDLGDWVRSDVAFLLVAPYLGTF